MSGELLDRGLLAVAALLVVLLVFAGLRRSPRVVVVAWLAVICFVPVWIGQTVGAYFPAFALVGLLVLASLLPLVTPVRWSAVDAVLAGVVVLVLAEFVLGLTTRSGLFDLVLVWGAAYLLGRVITSLVDPRWVYGAVGVAFGLAAALAVVEFLSGVNPFVSYLANGSSNFRVWGTLQPRGGILRAEGAFGHSIALGTSLGIAATLTLGSRFRPAVKLALVVLMVAACVLTFSRTGMLTAGLGLVLGCLLLREQMSRRARTGLLVLILAGAAVAFGTIRDVFLESGTEAAGSASYRTDLLQLVAYLRPFGLAETFATSTNQDVSIGDFGSVDNTLLLFGLTYGWVPLVLVALVLASAAVPLLRGRATPAVIALVAAIPGLVTVALITQYAAVFWFTAGLAVSTQLLSQVSAAAGRGVGARPRRPVLAAGRV